MFHCPHCGSSIHEDEQFCVVCGKKLPLDIEDRMKQTKVFNKWWFLPIGIFTSILITVTILFFMSESNIEQAEHHYILGAAHIEEEEFSEALEQFELALDYHPYFTKAKIAFDFLTDAQQMDEELENFHYMLEDKQFNDALEKISMYENELRHLQGPAVNYYINRLASKRDVIEYEQINFELSEQPSIDRLKVLLWEAESINTTDGVALTEQIRSEIINYIFSTASEQLNNNQFNDALILVEDGLKYAAESPKLQSLKSTIDTEKIAFETAQQERIEQAITIAEQEEQYNRNDAIQLDNVTIEVLDSGNIVVEGHVKSAATVPITSVFVEYELNWQGEEPFTTNRVFVFPDVLYPDEHGQFEFTHYDVTLKEKPILINVNKITWYID